MSRLEYPLVTSTWSEEEWRAGLHVLKGGHTTMGENVREFERQYAKYCGTEHAVMVGSGSSANLLMVAALVYSGRLARWARVAVPAVAWSTTLSPLAHFGLRAVVVDVDDSLNIDPAQIPHDVDAVFAINLLGNPANYERFPKDVIVLEDNCEAMGARYQGQMTGSIGVMASHSLFFAHHIHSMEGGVITTDDDELWRMLLMLRSHGWTRDLPGHVDDFDGSFEFRVPGFNVRPTDVQGAIAVHQIAKLPGIVDQRRANGAVYQEVMGYQREIGESSWYGFPIYAANRAHALSLLEGVEVRPVLAGNILRHGMMGYCDFEIAGDGMTKVANRVHDNWFFIGNHPFDVGDSLRAIAARLEGAADAA